MVLDWQRVNTTTNTNSSSSSINKPALQLSSANSSPSSLSSLSSSISSSTNSAVAYLQQDIVKKEPNSSVINMSRKLLIEAKNAFSKQHLSLAKLKYQQVLLLLAQRMRYDDATAKEKALAFVVRMGCYLEFSECLLKIEKWRDASRLGYYGGGYCNY